MIKNLFFLFILAPAIFAGTKDTTFSGDLNRDNIADRVIVSFTTNDGAYSYIQGDFSVSINGIVYKDKCEEAEVFDAKIVDIDSDTPALLVSCFGTGDVGEFFFYRLKEDKIIRLGSIKIWGGIEVPGNGKILSNEWMGFWSLHGEYAVNSSGKIEMVKKDTYDVNVEGTVQNSFKILKSRNDNSEVVETLKAGIKIKVMKCDISPVCKNEAGYDDEYECDWYLVKSSTGKEGWVRFKFLRDNTTDLPWAG
ncbi:MAG: hypothetical protein JSS63_05980 [Bacteroidetes bacterium]|nr:hypothetical protein [Bacteroidota bacterium]